MIVYYVKTVNNVFILLINICLTCNELQLPEIENVHSYLNRTWFFINLILFGIAFTHAISPILALNTAHMNNSR